MAKLAETILDTRVQSPNYFQGRLLTASDLNAERDAHLVRQRMLGRAIGSGVVEGLWVEKDPSADDDHPVVAISAGLAINAEGQLLSLADSHSLNLSEALQESETEPSACLFEPCDPPETEAVPTGDGFYLLVVSPSSAYREKAPMSSLDGDKAGAGCGRRWAVPGVRFRLEAFDPLNVPGMSYTTRTDLEELVVGAADTEDLSRLRNLVAHLCFGTDELAGHPEDPWAEESGNPLLAGYGTVDYLLSLDVLTSCDVPLALIYWSGNGLEIVDCWAVRRRPLAAPLSVGWPSLAGHRLRVENEARLFQFQDHLDDVLAGSTTPSTIDGSDYFRFLPAAGLLPVQGTTRPHGFTYPSFFSAKTFRDPTIFIEGSRLRGLLELSFGHPPVDLSAEEMVWIYHVRENYQPAAGETVSNAPPYSVFASSHLPFAGTSRFDVQHWDYANFGLL